MAHNHLLDVALTTSNAYRLASLAFLEGRISEAQLRVYRDLHRQAMHAYKLLNNLYAECPAENVTPLRRRVPERAQRW